MTELGTSLALVGAYVLAIALRDASMRWMGRWPIRPLMAEQFAKARDITAGLPALSCPLTNDSDSKQNAQASKR